MAEVVFSRSMFIASPSTFVAWVELYHVDAGGTNTTYTWASIPVGLKDPRVLSFGNYQRGVSDVRSGHLSGFTFAFELADTDGKLRAFLTDDDTRYLMNREAAIFINTVAGIANGDDPKVIARGVVKRWSYTEEKRFRFECEDLITRDFDMIIPKRIIRSADGWTANLGKAEPIVYGGEFDDGEWPAIFGRQVTYDAGGGGGVQNWSRCIVAGHAVKAISEVYKYASDGSRTDLTANIGTSVQVNKSIDINGRRYAIIDVVQGGGSHGDQIAAGTHYLGVSVDGVETAADGTGTLLTSGYLQYRHFMKNFAFGDYLTGAWAATGEPEWADATTPKVDEDSFATADTTYDTAFNPAHTATWGITDFLPLRDQVAIMNQSCGLVSWFSRKGTYFVGLAPRAWSLPSVTDTITEVQDIFQGSFQVDDFPSGRELINTVPYSYGKRYHGPGEAWAVTNAISQASGAILTAQRQTAVLTPGLDLHMIRDATTAGLVAALLVSSEVRTSVIRVKSGLFWLQRDLMQLFQLTHGSGSGANGYAAEKVTWMHESVDLDNDVIEMVLEDTFAT